MGFRFDLHTVVQIGIVLFVAAMVIAVVLGTLGLGTPRAPSEYSGQVVDVENDKGFVFQTSQVHLKTGPQSSSAETFCVHPDNKDEQMPVLRGALSNGSRVTVEYERPYFVGRWECENDTSIVTDVEIEDQGDD